MKGTRRRPATKGPLGHEWHCSWNETKAVISQKEGWTDMTLRKQTLLLVCMASVLWTAGCDLEKGVRDGLNDGLSAALASLIETPVNYILDQVFAPQ